MKRKTDTEDATVRVEEAEAENHADIESPPDADEFGDLDEPDTENIDDDRWDVFLFDDDSDPLPDYGDFWFPD